MKIDDTLRAKLVEAVEKCGGAQEFSKICGINAANISRYLRGITLSIKDDNWEKLAPFLENDTTEDENSSHRERDVISASAELSAFISARMKSAGIKNVEKLRQRMNASSYEMLRRQISGKLNWFADTLSRVFEVLDIDAAEAPLSDTERQLVDNAAMKRQGNSIMRQLPVLAGMEYGQLFVDGSVPVPLEDIRELRAFRISDNTMRPLLQAGDIIITEMVKSPDDIPENAVAVIRFADESSGQERIFCRRVRRLTGYPLILSGDDQSAVLLSVMPENVSWCGLVRTRISHF